MNERVARTLYNMLAAGRKMHLMSVGRSVVRSVGRSFKLAIAVAGFRVGIVRRAGAGRLAGMPASLRPTCLCLLRYCGKRPWPRGQVKVKSKSVVRWW